jgi:DNA-binding response OmpR family regulator
VNCHGRNPVPKTKIDSLANPSVRKKVLIVEDEELTRELLRDFLILEGFDVGAAGDGEEGCRLFRELRPDVVVTDILMPRKSGFALVSELRREYSDIRVIYMSGALHERPVSKDLEAELSLHPECQAIGKPFRLEDMLDSVKQALKE